MKRVSLEDAAVVGVSHNPDIAKRVVLDAGEVPGLTTFSQAVLTSGQAAPAHAHKDIFEVFFVRQGRGVIVIDGAEHALTPDACVVVEPGEMHEVGNRHEEDLVLLYFGLEA